ncbi:MAG TPA: hypothetical protein VJ739_00435 [Gemmataceae bacterium]|nr:hypothetical protein [Gemmataceae bacterium]
MSGKQKRVPARPKHKSSLPLRPIDPEALAVQQGVKPIANPEELFADFWPAEETADQLVQAVRRWRREGRAGDLS